MFPSLMLGAPRKRKSRKKPKALKWPHAEALAYARELGAIVDQTTALIDERLIPLLGMLHAEANALTSAPRGDDTGDLLSRVMAAIKAALDLTDERARGLALTMLARVQGKHAVSFEQVYDGILAIDPLLGAEPWLRDHMSASVAENVRLIKSIPSDLLDDVEGVVNRHVLAGTRVEDIAKLVRERYGVAESRAMLIATDQVGKWHGSLSRLRQLDAGVTQYVWSTSHDEVVRPLHAARDGKTFDWDNPPSDGAPGMAIRCRCQPIAVIDEL
jgi:SPP1 gp7 family putative phage head morphogenesis protein